jgi:hypothetical protein
MKIQNPSILSVVSKESPDLIPLSDKFILFLQHPGKKNQTKKEPDKTTMNQRIHKQVSVHSSWELPVCRRQASKLFKNH